MSDINLDKASELVSAIRTLDEKYHEERAKLRERLRAALGTDKPGLQVRKGSKPRIKKSSEPLNVTSTVGDILLKGPASVPQILAIVGKEHEVAVRSALKKAKARGRAVNMEGVWALAVPAYKEPEQKKTPEPVKVGGNVPPVYEAGPSNMGRE